MYIMVLYTCKEKEPKGEKESEVLNMKIKEKE